MSKSLRIAGNIALLPVGFFGLGACLVISAAFFNGASENYNPITGSVIYVLGFGFALTPPIMLVQTIMKP
jgi:hypothetical protein